MRIYGQMKNEEVKCKVDHLLYGHLENSSPIPVEITERQTLHQDLNPKTKYVWEVNVPARGKAEIVFDYYIKNWVKSTEVPESHANYSDQ